jgi:hypothetical protein
VHRVLQPDEEFVAQRGVEIKTALIDSSFVIPAKAGIQFLFYLCKSKAELDPSLRWDDSLFSVATIQKLHRASAA